MTDIKWHYHCPRCLKKTSYPITSFGCCKECYDKSRELDPNHEQTLGGDQS